MLAVGGVRSPEYGLQSLCTYLKGHEMELFVAEATAKGRYLAAEVAAAMGLPMATDVSQAELSEGALLTTRMRYGGKAVAQEKLTLPAVITAGRGRFKPVPGEKSVQEFLVLSPDAGVKFAGYRAAEKEDVDLASAKRVVSVGMGLRSADDLEIARRACKAMQAELSCSRGVAEERKWLPVSRFVGISGNVIHPDIYLAAGISGQIQHVFGVRDAKIIVAVNSNEKAPIFAAADYGIVGDLYEILPLLTEKLLARGK